MFYIQEQRKSKTHKIIFFRWTRKCFTYIHNCSVDSRQTRDISFWNLVSGVCGWKICTHEEIFFIVVERSSEHTATTRSCAMTEFGRKTTERMFYDIRSFSGHTTTDEIMENCSMKQVHVAIDHELRQSISALITSGLVSTHAPLNQLPQPPATLNWLFPIINLLSYRQLISSSHVPNETERWLQMFSWLNRFALASLFIV